MIMRCATVNRRFAIYLLTSKLVSETFASSFIQDYSFDKIYLIILVGHYISIKKKKTRINTCNVV